MPLQQACDRSDDVEFVSKLWCADGIWFLNNRAGVVIGRGRTALAACEDLLGPVQVNP